jgi:outer membrane protein OmpA-like peptidoglycan-associated protein
MRAVAQFTTDLTVSDRQVYVGLVGLQLGLPLKAIAPKLVLKSDPQSDIQVKVDEASELARSGPVLKGSGASSFDLGSSELKLQARQALVRFGEALSLKPEDWDKVVVEGHTDSEELSVEEDLLSQRRADAVGCFF